VPSVLVIADGWPDAAARSALEKAGLEPREPPEGDLAKLAEGADLVLVSKPGLADSLAIARAARASPLMRDAPAIVAIERADAARLPAGEGADDFVYRPIDAEDLAARARFLLHRTRRPSGGDVVRCEDLAIDTRRYEVTLAGRRVDLTLKEYELLLFLAERPGEVFTREVLLDKIWGTQYFGGTRTVDVHVRRLRAKIERAGRVFVDTVRGVGYKFNG
jgi:DNA-binding response OmpR family regulator